MPPKARGKAAPPNREFLRADFARKPAQEDLPANREFLHRDAVRTPPAEAAVAGLNYPSTLVGTVGNITVYYATSLGAPGQTLATAMLGRVLGPYYDMETWFGVSGGPTTVVVAPLSGSNDGSGRTVQRLAFLEYHENRPRSSQNQELGHWQVHEVPGRSSRGSGAGARFPAHFAVRCV